jgi:hypothetical protein
MRGCGTALIGLGSFTIFVGFVLALSSFKNLADLHAWLLYGALVGGLGLVLVLTGWVFRLVSPKQCEPDVGTSNK